MRTIPKARLDQPEKMALRSDYQLLHDSYQYEPDDTGVRLLLFATGVMCFIGAILGLVSVIF